MTLKAVKGMLLEYVARNCSTLLKIIASDDELRSNNRKLSQPVNL